MTFGIAKCTVLAAVALLGTGLIETGLVGTGLARSNDGGVIVAGKPMTSDEYLKRQLSGGPVMDRADLDMAIAAAKVHPLGSAQNPVRASGPLGQHAYLNRLRCVDGHAPYFTRIGNVGRGIYASIVDDYVVDCAASAPGQVHVMMDMYFSGHVETEPAAGFSIVPPE